MRLTENDLITCQACGKPAIRRGPTQRYCPPCSALKDVERKQSWQASTGLERSRERSAARKEAGSQASDEAKRSILWASNEEITAQRAIRVSVPFDWNFSKNAIYRSGRGGHVFIREEVRSVRDNLVERIKESGAEWFDGKVWIDLLVQKPNQRGDAINVIDLVCDAVKVAIGVDDRWFSIKRLDWEIAKNDPRIFVGISQEVTEHHRACSSCGIVKTLDAFGKSSRDKLGASRECRECSRALDRERRDRKKAAA